MHELENSFFFLICRPVGKLFQSRNTLCIFQIPIFVNLHSSRLTIFLSLSFFSYLMSQNKFSCPQAIHISDVPLLISVVLQKPALLVCTSYIQCMEFHNTLLHLY